MPIIKNGPLKDKLFRLEGELSAVFGSDHRYGPKDFRYLIMYNNMAALEAQARGYQESDAPFYAGYINSTLYIVSHHDLYGSDPLKECVGLVAEIAVERLTNLPTDSFAQKLIPKKEM